MQVRLSIEDQAYVRALQAHIAASSPLGMEVGKTDVVRAGLRAAAEKAGITPVEIHEQLNLLRLEEVI